MRRSSLPLILGLLSSLCGCRLAPFDALEADAPIATLTPGAGYPQGGYGRVLTAYEAVLTDGSAVSRVAVSAGPSTPIALHDAWSEGTLGDFTRTLKVCDDIATDMPDCDRGTGGALAYMPQWMGRRDCVAISAIRVGVGASPGEGQLRVKCESMSGTFTLSRIEGIGYGTALASMPVDSVHGTLLVGAPGAESTGQIHRLPSAAVATEAIPLPEELQLVAGARLGTALATAPLADASAVGLDSDAVLIAAAAPGQARVVLLALGLFTDPELGGAPAPTTRALACLDGLPVRSPSEALELGQGLALGDVTGDGVAELLVGATDGVRLLRLDDAGEAVGCASTGTEDDPTVSTLACPTGLDASCDGFGASLAIGDADADGTNDLLVGAPRSRTPEGTTGAGFLLRGTPSGPVFEGARALFVAGLADGALLGEEAAFVRAGTLDAPRYEPLLSSPGESRVFAFLCSGLPGDAAEDDARCQPRSP